jgi:hypothetical protein
MYSYIKMLVKLMGISYSLFTIVSQTKFFSRGNMKKGIPIREKYQKFAYGFFPRFGV